MSIRCSSTSLISGAIVCGVPGLGVLGSTILATTGSGGSGPGILFNDVQAGDDSKEFRAEVLTWPTAGSIDLQEDGRLTYTGPSADALSYRLWVDGVAMGTASVSLYGVLAGVTLGAGSDATATADAGGSALFSYALGAGSDASDIADAGGSALFANALGGAADAVLLADAGGSIGGPIAAPETSMFLSVAGPTTYLSIERHWMESIITDNFPKQPRETKWLPISFAELLAAEGDTARAVNPMELDTVPDGITVEDQVFDPVTSKFQLLVGGGVDGRTYKLTMWINTTSGQRIEHEIKVKVKER